MAKKKNRKPTGEQIRKLVMARLKQYAGLINGVKLKQLLKGKRRSLKIGDVPVEVTPVQIDQRKLQKLIRQEDHWQLTESVVQVCFAPEVAVTEAEKTEVSAALKAQELKPEVVEYLRLCAQMEELEKRLCYHMEHACLRELLFKISRCTFSLDDDHLIVALAALLAHQEHQEHRKKEAEAG